MICEKLKYKLNTAKIKGIKHITVPTLTESEKQELTECGYTFKFITERNYYIINL